KSIFEGEHSRPKKSSSRIEHLDQLSFLGLMSINGASIEGDPYWPRQHRFGRAPKGGQKRIGYADPPYPGCANLYKDHPDFGGEVDHAALIKRLEEEFD